MATERDAVQRWWCIGVLLRELVEKSRGDRYLKMAPSDSPSKNGIKTNLRGLSTRLKSPYHIWQLCLINTCNRHIYVSEKKSGDYFLYPVFNKESHGDLGFDSFQRPDTAFDQTTRSK